MTDGGNKRRHLSAVGAASVLEPDSALSDMPAAGMDESGTVASGESEQALLAAGKITLDEFMDMSVDRALAHLDGQISSERMKMMREILRSQLEQDPHLSSLVQRAAAGV